jgi:hypothetical protein
MLQAGSSRIPVSMRSLNFLIYLILPAALGPAGGGGGVTQPLTGKRTRNRKVMFQEGRARPALNADKLLRTDCLVNVGSSTSHNPISLHDLLQG